MKKQIIVSAFGAMLLASCADHFDQNFETVRPDKLAEYGYLEKYDALKEYIADKPNFHLGIGTTVDEYNKQELVYALTNSNFNETVAGNAMKMASCVADDGSMDFEKVSTYVNNATDAGLSVYGHTLAWHSQQPLKYLNGLIADRPAPEVPGGDNKYIRYTTAAAGANLWDNQANFKLSEPLEQGASYTLTMKVKASADCDLAFWPIWNASPNKNQWGGSNDVQYCEAQKATTEWATLTWKFDALFTHDMLQFCFGKLGGTIDFDDIKLVKDGSDANLVANGDFATDDISAWGNNWQGPTFKCEKIGSGIPLTDKEKKEVLTTAMDKWIAGMMEATQGKVKAWDVVNEALSGADTDGDGKYDLQSATRGTALEADIPNSFYWQDYLGDLDYVRTAVASARKHFEENGGNPEELKLFINDYNLESDWDNNGKLKSLIQWIKDWEADGVTKIDGIGSQMHISCYGNPQTQESKKNAIVNMLKLMAESGKLVRISELDMNYVDETDKSVNTNDMTEEQHKQMRELYEFVIKKYFEIIPEAQQWGICQWCPTDSPANSGWRAGAPTGLWDKDYYRKHTYAGFAAGLGAPELWNDAK